MQKYNWHGKYHSTKFMWLICNVFAYKPVYKGMFVLGLLLAELLLALLPLSLFCGPSL